MQSTQNLLTFLYQLGVNSAFLEAPRNRFAEKDTPPPFKKLSFVSMPPLNQEPPLQSTPLISIQSSPIITDPMARTKIIIDPAMHPAYKCNTLEELRQAILAFEDCPLKHTAMNTVFCDGNPDADVMLVGEAPGADEDEQGKPFVGRCGQLLDKMLLAIGLDRTKVYIANMIPWRPPGNRPPSTQEIAQCLPFIERHIFLKQPKFLLLLGAVATKALLNNNTGIMRLRGQWQNYKPSMTDETYPTIQALPTFHPAFLLRSPGQKVYAWEDLKTLKAAVDAAE
ncbi:MAG: uracil-DNA glycosylase [Alphaproteobacteria bacterium]|nr:uracil-DNA glycosylase [Alphaproteobacteria bacterium]